MIPLTLSPFPHITEFSHESHAHPTNCLNMIIPILPLFSSPSINFPNFGLRHQLTRAHTPIQSLISLGPPSPPKGELNLQTAFFFLNKQLKSREIIFPEQEFELKGFLYHELRYHPSTLKFSLLKKIQPQSSIDGIKSEKTNS